MGEWSYSSAHSRPWRWIEVSGQLHDLTGLPQGKSLHSHWTACWVGFENRKLCCLIWESYNSFNVQNFVVQVIWHPQFVHPFFKLFLKVRVMVLFSLRREREILYNRLWCHFYLPTATQFQYYFIKSVCCRWSCFLSIICLLVVKSLDESIVPCYIHMPLRSNTNRIGTKTYFTCADTLHCSQVPLFYYFIIGSTEYSGIFKTT